MQSFDVSTPVTAPPLSDSGSVRPNQTSCWKRFTQSNNRWHKLFARQQLPGWSPIITAKAVVFFYFLAGLILIPLGIAILLASLNVVEYKVHLDFLPSLATRRQSTECQCIRSALCIKHVELCAVLCPSCGPWCLQVRYDNVGPFALGSNRDAQQRVLYAVGGEGVPLTVSITVEKQMEPPVRLLCRRTACQLRD